MSTRWDTSPYVLSEGEHQTEKHEPITVWKRNDCKEAVSSNTPPDWADLESGASLKARCYFHTLFTSMVIAGLTFVICSGNIVVQSFSQVGVVALMVINLMMVRKVSSYIDLLHQANESVIAERAKYFVIAQTDTLTGLPNRLALDRNLENLPIHGSLTFIDIDGLKYYNDRFGHARGDELLRYFAVSCTKQLSGQAQLHRLGGDEFAITSASGDVNWIEQMLKRTVADLNANGFELVDASCGSAFAYETPAKATLQHLADCRMYESKRLNKSR